MAITMSLSRIMPPEEVERLAAPLFERLGEYALTGVGLATVVKGVKDGKRYTIKYGIACKDAAWLTALPAALGALELASGEVARAGVYPPEAGVIDVDGILKKVKEQVAIEVTETKFETL